MTVAMLGRSANNVMPRTREIGSVLAMISVCMLSRQYGHFIMTGLHL